MTRFRLASLLVSFALLSGCAYYNGMWSAQRLARDAQRLETRGQEAEARTVWGRAAIKAESVLVHHANSRWADDALVLQGEALARSGSCAAAARPLTRALQNVSDDALHERAALAAAECALRLGEVAAAERLLVPLLASTDARRRSSAAYLAGRAAFDRGDAVTAAERFARSERDEAAPAQVRAVVAAGGTDRAVALIESVAHRDRDEARWAEALADLGRQAGAAIAADGLDRLLVRGRLPAGSRARLLLADGDRLRAAQVIDRAATRYAQVASLVPDSAEGGRSRSDGRCSRGGATRRFGPALDTAGSGGSSSGPRGPVRGDAIRIANPLRRRAAGRETPRADANESSMIWNAGLVSPRNTTE